MRFRLSVSAQGPVAALMLCAVTAPVWAQAPPAIRSVIHTRIKPDKMGDWIAAEKEFSATLKKGGSDRGYTVWEAMTGPREFIRVHFMAKWAEFDRAADPKMVEYNDVLTGITARIMACMDGSWREIHSMEPDLMLPRPAEMPKMIRAARITVAPGKMDEVLAAMKSVALPAMKSAGITSYGVGRVRYGTGTDQLLSHTGFNSWADLDGPTPIEKAAGRDAYLKYVEKIGTLTMQTEWTVYKFRPELSYIPSSK